MKYVLLSNLNNQSMAELPRMMSPEFIAQVLENPLQDEKCELLHVGSCNGKALQQFFMGCKGLYKMYLLVHLIPLLTLKRKKLMQNPLLELKKLIIAFGQSMLFAGGCSMVIRRMICLLTHLYSYDYRIGRVCGVAAGVTLIFQQKGRQTQIALYVLNKSMETGYNMLIRRNYPVHVAMGECWLIAVAIAVLAYVYVNDPWIYRENYRKVLDYILGSI